MQDVYLNCHLNISILHAKGPSKGAFARRNPHTIRRCDVSWAPDRVDEQTWTVLNCRTDSFVAINLPTLASRAWVVQERLLAPRTVHFSHDRIFWECRGEFLRSETFPSGLEALSPFSMPALFPFKMPLPKQAAQVSTEKGLPSNWPLREIESWHQILEHYTWADLSRPDKDRLVAIAGVAKRFGAFFGDNYCAGLFRSHLPQDLLWRSWGYRPLEQSPRSSRQGIYRGPSWSWASLDGEIQFPKPGAERNTCSVQTTVESTQILGVDEQNIYGQVIRAQITLCGVIRPCHVTRIVEERCPFAFTGKLMSGASFYKGHNLRQTPKRRRLSNSIFLNVHLDNLDWPLSSQDMMAFPILHYSS
ncbi:hypothetical protein B0J12DRAFT_181218 [Macrophomina phaseolina]|uniref:Heterokaryon incompatibility domain-containing protein n=1 Tax=Macrophomina phaseolina TaxID=35725 RepID=A0ABQ8G4H6_9PEZI|nr:hypothetical protein B0J12DRAFT_181218 [Macrophomina phaseolina]